MFVIHLFKNFEDLRKLGLVRSRREYARVWLGRGQHYFRDLANRDRGWQKLSPITASRLRANLEAVAGRVPADVADEIMTVIRIMDSDTAVATTMMEWGR